MSKDWELEEIQGQAESHKISPYYQGKNKIDKNDKLIKMKKPKNKRICWCCKRNVPKSETHCLYCATEYSETRPVTIIAKDVVLNHDGTWKFKDWTTHEEIIDFKIEIDRLQLENKQLNVLLSQLRKEKQQLKGIN